MRDSVIMMLLIIAPFWVLLFCLWMGAIGYNRESLIFFAVFCVTWIVIAIKKVDDGNKDS